jgi:hypothetical protein
MVKILLDVYIRPLTEQVLVMRLKLCREEDASWGEDPTLIKNLNQSLAGDTRLKVHWWIRSCHL